MKALILTAALPLLACAARAQDAPPPIDVPAETVKKAHAAAWLGIANPLVLVHEVAGAHNDVLMVGVMCEMIVCQ